MPFPSPHLKGAGFHNRFMPECESAAKGNTQDIEAAQQPRIAARPKGLTPPPTQRIKVSGVLVTFAMDSMDSIDRWLCSGHLPIKLQRPGEGSSLFLRWLRLPRAL